MLRRTRSGRFPKDSDSGSTGMANLERGTYDSSEDNLRAFDFDDEEPPDQEGGRLPLLVGVAILVLAAFAGVVWLAYTQGVERGRAEAPQILAERAARVAKATVRPPAFTGLNIYQAQSNGRSAAQNVLGAIHLPSAPPALRPTANGGSESFAAGTVPTHPFAAPAPAPTTNPTRTPVPTPVKPAVETAKSTVQAVGPAVSNLMKPSIVPTIPERLHGILLQIGSYKSQAEARQSWLAFRAAHSTAAGYQPDIKQVDLGAKGNWYRLRIGPFENKDAATEVCAKLRAAGASCLIAR